MFERTGQVHQPGFVECAIGGQVDADDPHLAGRHGAGLVEDDGVGPTGCLEHLGTADQQAELRPTSTADQQRRGRGESQRAPGQAMTSTATAAATAWLRGEPPTSQPASVKRGQAEHDRHEHRGDAVGQALDARLGLLGLGDEAADLGELGVGPDPCRLPPPTDRRRSPWPR